MFNKIKPLVVLILALCGIALLGSQVWADPPPKAREIIFGADQDIKVQFEPNGDVAAVYFLDCTDGVGCCDTTDPVCWGEPAIAEPGYICTCVGTECVTEDEEGNGDTALEINLARFNANGNSDNFTFDCHEMTNSGPRSTGCPLYGSRSYTIGGVVYSR